MKKLYLIFLSLLLLFIPATNAVSVYQLDQPLPELNGYTLRELFESTTPTLDNLVTNGDFSDGTTGWTSLNSNNVVSNGIMQNTADGTSNTPRIRQVSINTNIDDVIYTKIRFRVTNSDAQIIYNRSGSGSNSNMVIINNPIQNQWYVESFGLKKVSNDVLVDIYHNYIDSATALNKVMEVDYVMYFDLTVSHGVTATSGPTYDKAVDEIEWLISKNDGYIQTVGNPFKIVDLTIRQMDMYYYYYLEAVQSENTSGTEFFLISIFFMYILIMTVGYFTKGKYFYFAGSLLWLVPIFNYQNIFIITTSIIVFLIHLVIIFYSDKDDVFE